MEPDARRELLAHVDACAPCRELAAAASRMIARPATPANGTEDVESAADATIGRYVVLGQIGAGAMGEVYAAYDAELDRKVAVKLLREQIDARGVEMRLRLGREAKVLAKLSHPNVVPVYDAGVHDNRTFVAMELVDGRTLRQWLDERRRSWREVVSTFALAGRGLAAAHEAGIVHRDFKPDNVLVADDGRVRVADFGLARLDAQGASASPGDVAAEAITRSGQIMGTPVYMAPELFTGEPASPASDQFSFAVALYEALYGVRPFAGNAISDLLRAVGEGRLRPPAREARVPGWVRRAVVRGLSAHPEARHQSMAALLDALGPARRRWRSRLMAMATALLAVLAIRPVLAPRSVAACAGGAGELARAWNDGRRIALRSAILANGTPAAAQTWGSVERELDRHAAEWVAMYREACAATHVRGEQSTDLLDRRMVCLRHDRDELGALAETLSVTDPGTLEHAATAAYQLPAVSRCSAEALLRTRAAEPQDPDARARGDAFRGDLARVHALLSTGHFESAVEAAERLAASAAKLGDPEAEALALVALGRAQRERRQLDRAAESYDTAVRAAVSAGDDRTAAEALLGDAFVVGALQLKRDAAAALLHYAGPPIERLNDDSLRAQLVYREGILRYDGGDFWAARERFRRALELARRALGPAHPDVADFLTALAKSERATGSLHDAREHYRQALAIQEEALGAFHPRLNVTVGGLGVVEADLGHDQQALDLAERSLFLSTQGRGLTSRDRGLAMLRVGEAQARLGRYADSLRTTVASLAILEQAGADHYTTAEAHYALAELETVLGRYDEALEHAARALDTLVRIHAPEAWQADVVGARAVVEARRGKPGAVADAERAVALKVQMLGPGHADGVRSLLTLCDVVSLVRPGEAIAPCMRAFASATAAYRGDHPAVGHALGMVGTALLDLGRFEAAFGPLERALAILDDHGELPLVARFRFALAQALWARGSRPAARSHAAASVALYSAIGSADTRELTAVQRWLEALPSP
jgi:tetratricopeptide (TPR) repeat protein/tRNA A-37 threonylcarbamoyl transferase component Bud32